MKSHRATLFLVAAGFMLTSSVIVQAAPMPTIPLMVENSPSIDGVIRAGEWKGSAVLVARSTEPHPQMTDYLRQDGSEPATRFFLRHDGTALWVAVQCEEVPARKILAQMRGPEGNLFQDDAVSVALGLGGGAERDISMGGYAGAMVGKVGTMARMYDFTVNAAGATARRYNESPLPSARFVAKTTRSAKGWQVEMRIPFDSLSLSKPEGREIFANFVRYRPPAAMTWRGASYWGNYTPFPTDKIRLAATKLEPASAPDLPAMGPGKKDALTAVAPSLDIQYFPLTNTVFGQATLPGGGSAILTADGKATTSKATGSKPIARELVELPFRPSEGDTVKATLQTIRADGKPGPSKTVSFEGIAKPSWAGTDIGKKYVNDAVPSPWTTPKIQGDTVRLTHVTLAFGGNALPKSIRGIEPEILGRPIDVLAWSKGKHILIKWAARPVLTLRGNRVIVLGRGVLAGAPIEVRTEVDFDGFMTTQIRFQKAPPGIDKLQLSCPLKSENARFATQGGAQQVVKLDSGDYSVSGGMYVNRCWIGAENAGLAFTSDIPFFHNAVHRGEIAIKNEGAVRNMVLTSMDRAEQFTKHKVLQFYVQPTPVRPRSKEVSDNQWLWFEQWSDYQGYPDLAKMEKVKEHSKTARAGGGLPMLYFNQMLAENTPEFKTYRNELINLPEKMWYKRAYDGPGKDVPCYVCCVRGPYGDLLLDGIRKLIDEGDIGGIYMDGTQVAWYCDNPAHPACDEWRDPVWGVPGQTRIRSTRDFLKRLRGLFTERGKKFIMAGHTGGDLEINSLSFVDYFWEGEQLSRYLPGYRIPQYQFAVGYSGGPWGYRTQFFDTGWTGNRGENWSLAYTLLYNADNQKDNPRRFLRPFEIQGSTFHPYWKDGQRKLKSSKTGRTSVSYYTAPKAAVMIVASNLEFKGDEAEIDVSDFTNQTGVWVDTLTRTRYSAKAGTLRVALPPYQAVALRPLEQVSEEDKKPAFMADAVPAVSVGFGQKAEWQVSDETLAKRDETPDGLTGLKLRSVPRTPASMATLKGVEFGRDIEFTVKMKADNRFDIDLGSVLLLHDTTWRMDVKPAGWNEGDIRQVALPADRPFTLKVALHENFLSVWLDGEVVFDNVQIQSRPQARGQLKISTWAGDSLELQLQELNTQPVEKLNSEALHPAKP